MSFLGADKLETNKQVSLFYRQMLVPGEQGGGV